MLIWKESKCAALTARVVKVMNAFKFKPNLHSFYMWIGYIEFEQNIFHGIQAAENVSYLKMNISFMASIQISKWYLYNMFGKQ